MSKFAVVETGADRIDREIILDERFTILPIVETEDTPGPNQILGAPTITIGASAVTVHRSAVRALTGTVAIVGEDGTVQRIKDLGDQPIIAADNVYIYEAEQPDFDSLKQVMDGPTTSIAGDVLRQVWTVRDKTTEELAADSTAQAERRLDDKFGSLGIAVLLDQENRVRVLEGSEPLTVDEFRAQLMAVDKNA